MAETMSNDGFTDLDEMLFEEFLEYALENGEDYAFETAEYLEIDTDEVVQVTSQSESTINTVVELNTRYFMDDASCRDVDPRLFFPDYTNAIGEAAAKVICRSCVVQADCLDYALRNDEQSGIWGGATEKERSRINRRRRNSRAA